MGWVKRAGGVTPEWLAAGGFEVEVAGVRHPATLQPGAFYDPKGERMRG
jgi:4-methylaminobutanoate oxidase (formaldehyde-forming)